MENDAVVLVAVIVAEGLRFADQQVDAFVDKEFRCRAGVFVVIGPDLHGFDLDAFAGGGDAADAGDEFGGLRFVCRAGCEQSAQAFLGEFEGFRFALAECSWFLADIVDAVLEAQAFDLEGVADRLRDDHALIGITQRHEVCRYRDAAAFADLFRLGKKAVIHLAIGNQGAGEKHLRHQQKRHAGEGGPLGGDD